MGNFYQAANVTNALPELADALMDDLGTEVASRGGARVREMLHTQVSLFKPWQREVLTPDRKANIAAQIAETMWVLAGRNDIEWLSKYLPRAGEFSDDGQTWRAGYGPRIRGWQHNGRETDQVAEVLRLLRADNMTRRAVIDIYDPAEDFQSSKDIPCNNWLHFLNRNGKLYLQVAVRSNDLIWGWSGINTFEWSALQEILASLLGLEMGELTFNIGSLHVYDRHWSKAQRLAEARVGRDIGLEDSPRFWIPRGSTLEEFDNLLERWFAVERIIRTGEDYSEAIESFPEPMLRSWLQVLAWYWRGDDRITQELAGTRLFSAMLQTPASVLPENRPQHAETPEAKKFVDYVTVLHAGKDQAYGDSWVRRGEMLGVLANLARKVDRLGVEGGGETALDTAVDLLCYLAKYRVWLETGSQTGRRHQEQVERLLRNQPQPGLEPAIPSLENRLQVGLNNLEHIVMHQGTKSKIAQVDGMLSDARALAERLYNGETR